MVSLRIRVIIGAILLVAVISGTVFYLTAIQYHRLMEGELAVSISRHGRLAVGLWADRMPVSRIATYLLEDSTIIAVKFHPKSGETVSFTSDGSARTHGRFSEFQHHLDELSGPIVEIGEASGILHREGHLLLAGAEGEPGRIELLFSTEVVNREVARLVGFGNRVIAAVVLLAAVGIFLIDRRLRRVVRRLIATASTIAEGKLDVKVDIRTGDALEELSEGFNRLANSLARRREEINLAHEQLNRIIKTQTQDLRAERDRLSLILDNLPFAFILFDEDQQIIAASSAFQRMDGVLRDHGGTRECSCKLMTADGDCVVERARRSGGAIVGRQVRSTIDGEEKVFEHSAFPIGENNRIAGWLESVMDVTTRVSQHERLIRAERMSAVGEMASIIAHEIRNRLTSAKLLLHIETETDNLTQTQREHLQHAVESVHGMEMMVEDLLAFSRPDPLNLEAVEVDGLIESIIARIRPIAAEEGVSVECSGPVDRSVADLDYEKTHQAVTNLLLNAIQASGPGGRTRLTVSWDSREHARTDQTPQSAEPANTISERTGSLCFLIDDTGPGVAVELREKIFQPFQTTKPSGTGLGLAMVKQLAKSYGGSVSVRDSSLGGAKFTLSIPTMRKM